MSKSFTIAATVVLLGFGATAGMAQPPSSPVPGSGLEGVILIAPAHPGPSKVDVADTAPLANTVFIVTKGNETITSFTTDAQGAFRINLPPGHYAVSRKDAAPRIGHFGPFEVDLVEGQIAKVKWTCDTGMR